MPRMSEAEKHNSHNRILDAASLLFRERGIEATSVSDIMKAAGMTHGGFYRHFDSKEDLVRAAFTRAVDNIVADMESETTRAAQNKLRQNYIDTYLSSEHVGQAGRGCPLAAMGAELFRTGGLPAQAGAQAVTRMAALLQDDAETGQDLGLATIALLIGTITLARLSDSEEEADRVLETGRISLGLLQNHWAKPTA